MNIKKHIKEIVITLSVISLTTIGYAAVSTVSTGTDLTATIWNTMKDTVNSNEAKLTNISNAGGNISIGSTLKVQSPIVGKAITASDAQFYGRGSDNGYGIAMGALNNPVGSFIQFMLNDTPASYPILLNPLGGNIGIGTTSATSKVTILKPISGKDMSVAESHVYMRGSDNGYGLAMGVLNNPLGGFLQGKLNDASSASVPLFLNPEGGNVGIGTTSPSAKLHIKQSTDTAIGGIRITHAADGSGWEMYNSAAGHLNFAYNTSDSVSFLNNGSLSVGGSVVHTSDERLKENIEKIDSSLEKISKINGVSFDWIDKEKYSSKKQIGVIAQDVEKVFPELVINNEETGLKSVDYSKLVAPLIEAVKELSKQNEELKLRVELLESK